MCKPLTVVALSLLAAALLALPGCAGGQQAVRVDTAEIAPGVWVYTSWHTLEPWGEVPSNSVVLQHDNGVLLIDSAWNETQTRTLLRWSERTLGAPVTQAILTHAHDDRMGGADALRRAGVHTYATRLTQTLAPQRGLSRATHTLELAGRGDTITVGPATVLYPGAGHSADNVVVYVEDRQLLIGGCLIRSARSRSLGNTADASVAQWANSVAVVRERFSAAQVVVPGHGAVGGIELLDHTMKLANAERGE